MICRDLRRKEPNRFLIADNIAMEIWTSDPNGDHATRLTSFAGPVTGSPRWLPDGQQIVFDSRASGQSEIYSISVKGGQPQRLTNNPEADVVPTWSPDGHWIYFNSLRSGQSQIWRMLPDGSGATQITRSGGFAPTLSPDGRWVYYTKNRKAVAPLWRVPYEGGKERGGAPSRSESGVSAYGNGDLLFHFRGKKPALHTTVSGVQNRPDRNYRTDFKTGTERFDYFA